MKKWLLMGLLFITGCSSLSSFQTADTLPANTLLFGAGHSQGNFKLNADRGLLDYDYASSLIELFSRVGVIDSVDVGIRLVPFTFIEADLKYQFVKESGSFLPSMAIGYGVNYGDYINLKKTLLPNPWDFIFTNDVQQFYISDIFFPVYISKHILGKLMIYSSAKLHYNHIHVYGKTDPVFPSEDIYNLLPSINLGLAIDFNRYSMLMLEYSYLWTPDDTAVKVRNIGLAFVIKP